MCYEKKEVGSGVVTGGQGLGSSEEDESRVDDTTVNANNVSSDVLQIPQQQPQGPVIRWERFLPLRSLKVLLVENDDSTRQVVSALLRNCSYEVTAVANGLQAWKILEDVTNRIDLVLTEVVMPVLSGIGLLCKIMSHKTFKNIPVIMMSPHDSMNLVFKCLSKGAVDFLVKPIRKNELKNLWQHVWRRCHSSSGSGSESGTHTKKSAKTESNDGSHNNTSSSDEHENGSSGPSMRDGSDNGSGTQSSWTKKAADIDSPQPASPSYQLAEAPDSTCAQVIHTKAGTFSNGLIHVMEPKELEEQDEQLDDATIGDHLLAGICETSKRETGKKQAKEPEVDCSKHPCSANLENENLMPQNFISSIQEAQSKNADTPDSHVILQAKGKESSTEPEDMPSLELTLTRPTDMGNSRSDDRNVLRHSDLSAFSKYNTATSANKGPTGNVGSCSPHDASVAMKTLTPCNFPSRSSSTPLNQQSNGSSRNYDMASTAKCSNPKPESCTDKSELLSAFKPSQSSAFQPVQSSRIIPSSQPVLPQKTDDATGSASGSNHGSDNGQSGSGTAVNTEQAHGESDNAARGNSGVAASSSRKIGGGGADDDRAAQREAALMKFRQKRKERSFEKRVRYHSRKKLAEQRPRVKGQFIRRADSKSANECPSSGVASEDNSHDSVR